MTSISSVAVVGAGLVGEGWCIVFASAGLRVSVFEPSDTVRDGLLDRIEAGLADMRTAGLDVDIAAVLKRITLAPTLQAAVEQADYVQESVFERVETKRQISLDIDPHLAPHASVGSSSSGIPTSAFTEECTNRTRYLVAHPVNPPHLVPVVEVVPAPWTDPAVTESVIGLMRRVGQAPVHVRKEIQGFVLNRLQGALLNEAWALFEEGYASLEDIDTTVSEGLGLRWSFMGPFETIDLNAPGGIADYAQRLSALYHEIALSRCQPSPWSADAVAEATQARRAELPASDLLARRAWRDAYLARLAAFKQGETD